MEPAPQPIEPTRRTRLPDLLRQLASILVVLATIAVIYAAGRIVFYTQTDDRQHVASKRAYLDRIAELTGGDSSGPNLVFILFDDLGLGDLGAFGGGAIATPNLDRLASQGLVFRDAYAPSPYCSASRAGWLTGRYAVRAGLDHVLQVTGSWQDALIRLGGLNRRLPGEEITLAEVLQAAGYETAIIGKWHLGEERPSRPTDMGFDSFYGLLYSNDQGKPVVWRDTEIVERHPIDQATLTRRYTERAVAFIDVEREGPFFLYLPHTFPHVPLHVSGDRRGRSRGGLYGDVVEELDWSTGEVLAALDRAGVARQTMVVVSSDNGPWFQGSPGGLRGRKFNVFEGGMRVPLMVRWPRLIAAGTVDEQPAVGVDLFPTVLEAVGLPPPPDRVIDGGSLLRRFGGETEASTIWYHQIGRLQAIRDGRFKYHGRHRLPYGNPADFRIAFSVSKGPWLFDLVTDPRESYDVSARYPEVARRLAGTLAARQLELSENPRGWR